MWRIPASIRHPGAAGVACHVWISPGHSAAVALFLSPDAAFAPGGAGILTTADGWECAVRADGPAGPPDGDGLIEQWFAVERASTPPTG